MIRSFSQFSVTPGVSVIDYGCGAKPNPPSTPIAMTSASGVIYENGTMTSVQVPAGVHNVTFKNIRFTGGSGTLYDGRTPARHVFVDPTCYNITFDGCLFVEQANGDHLNMYGNASSYRAWHDIVIKNCWFEPCHLFSIEFNCRNQQHAYNLTIDHNTFEECDGAMFEYGGPISMDMVGGWGSSSNPPLINGEARYWENVTISNNLFYGANDAMVEWRGVQAWSGDPAATRSHFTHNKLGFAGACQFSFGNAGWWLDYPTNTISPHTGVRGAYFEDNLIDETWNPGGILALDSLKGMWRTGVQNIVGVGDGPRGEMNETVWSGNTFNLYRTATSVNIVRDNVAGRSPMGYYGNNDFIGNTWTTPSTGISTNGCNLSALKNSTFTNERFDMPGLLTFDSTAVGTDCTFTPRCTHTGGSFEEYGCEKPIIPDQPATLTGSTYHDGYLSNHTIPSGTHDRTYSYVTFNGQSVAGSEGGQTYYSSLLFGEGSSDTYNITFDHCVFKTPLSPYLFANLVKYYNSPSSLVQFHHITFSNCWFEPCHRFAVELNPRAWCWMHDITIDHCTFEVCDCVNPVGWGGSISMDMGKIDGTMPIVNGEERYSENMNITNNLLYGTAQCAIEVGGFQTRSGYEDATRSHVSGNKMGYAGAVQFSLAHVGVNDPSHPETGCDGVHFEDNLVDETWNPGGFARYDSYKGLLRTPQLGTTPRGKMNNCTWSNNTFNLYGNASSVAIVRDNVAARSPDGHDNVFIGNTWTSTSAALTSVGGDLTASDNLELRNEHFDLPGRLTFNSTARGYDCTFTSRCTHTGGTFT